jgi:hypothetical protein
MRAPRKLATYLLTAVVRHTPETSRDWAAGMLRELEFVEGNWAALFWALGSTAAVFRHVASGWREWLKTKSNNREDRMNNFGKKALGVGTGILSAAMLALCGFAMQRLVGYLFPSMHMANPEWMHWLSVIVVPESIFIVATVLLWRKKGPVAAGILVFAIVAALHVAIHVAMR